MTLKSQAHIEMMAMFERLKLGRLDKEPRESWAKERIYQDGRVNELFLAFRQGVAYGEAASR